MITEIQLNTKKMYKAGQKTHKLYDQKRKLLEEIEKTTNVDKIKKWKSDINKLEAKSRKIHNDAWMEDKYSWLSYAYIGKEIEELLNQNYSYEDSDEDDFYSYYED